MALKPARFPLPLLSCVLSLCMTVFLLMWGICRQTWWYLQVFFILYSQWQKISCKKTKIYQSIKCKCWSFLLWIHRFLTDSWRSQRLHYENFSSPSRWEKITIRRGRKQSTRWSVNWTVTYQRSSNTTALYEETPCATVGIVTKWTYSCFW